MKEYTLAYSPWGDRGNSIFPFNELFKKQFNPVATSSLDGADALLLWGGEDIHPSFYKQDFHPKTDGFFNRKHQQVSIRDQVEWHLMREAYAKNIPIIGVCRGAQFICIFSGGSLIQDVKGHYSAHGVVTYDGLSMHASANHHQMMNPAPKTYDLLAWSESFGMDHQIEGGKWATGELIDQKIDPEILWFRDVKGLAIQPHPEWMPKDSKFVQWCLHQVEEFVLKGK